MRGRHVLTPQKPDYIMSGGIQLYVYSLYGIPRLILGLRPTNERRRYFVMTSPIGWAQA